MSFQTKLMDEFSYLAKDKFCLAKWQGMPDWWSQSINWARLASLMKERERIAGAAVPVHGWWSKHATFSNCWFNLGPERAVPAQHGRIQCFACTLNSSSRSLCLRIYCGLICCAAHCWCHCDYQAGPRQHGPVLLCCVPYRNTCIMPCTCKEEEEAKWVSALTLWSWESFPKAIIHSHIRE
jgi:hypothetical protein